MVTFLYFNNTLRLEQSKNNLMFKIIKFSIYNHVIFINEVHAIFTFESCFDLGSLTVEFTICAINIKQSQVQPLYD